MSYSPQPGPQRAPIARLLAARGGELAVVAVAWLGLHELAHLRLLPLELAGVLAGWFTVWCGAAWTRWRWPAGNGIWRAGEFFGPGLALAACNTQLLHPLSFGRQILYVTVFLGTVATGWRAWVAWRIRRGADPVAEPVRVLLVALVPLLVLLPFFTDRLLGGTDARWYGFMLRDYLDQLHAGVFPVFIGQGEYAWNGAVHLFRSAPVYLNLAGFWDLLTARGLNVHALQHLTVLTAGLVGALGFYAAAAALLPTRRWIAAGFAALYVLAPAWLGVLYCSDAYMTFLALAALPAVLYGNARSLIDEDARGYRWLAVGLALVWMCHPPTALLSTLASVLLQGGSLLMGRAPGAQWRGAIVGGVLFLGLGAYYFVGMSELPKGVGPGLPDALQLAGLMLALTGLANGLLLGRSRGWLILVPIGAAVAGLGRGPWLIWIAVTSALVAVSFAAGRGRTGLGRHACVILFVALLLGAGLTQALVGLDHPAQNLEMIGGLKVNQLHSPEFFRPVSADLSTQGNFQPGPGLWVTLAVLAGAFFLSGSLAVRLFFIAACLPFFALVRVPWVSDFLLGFAPNGIAKIVSFTLPIRIMPMMSGLLAMGGVIWFASRPAQAPRAWLRWVEGSVVLLVVGWTLVQALPFMRRGWSVTATRLASTNAMRPENAVLERFTYDLLPHPHYLSHGRTDPWLQARVLDEGEKVVIGPDATARLMEKNEAQRLRLKATVEPTSPRWVNLTPAIKVQPGERLLVRFEFVPGVNYAGWLIWTAPHGYREYRLPESGMGESFGVNENNSRVVVLGNSTDQPQTYKLSQIRDPENSIAGNGDHFADAVVSKYVPAAATVRVETLMPSYKVAAVVPAAGWIETSRVWLPGYRTLLDGKPAQLRPSHRGLAMVAASPGRHELELTYVGTTKLWAALVVSALCWLGWVAWTVRGWLRPSAPPSSSPAA